MTTENPHQKLASQIVIIWPTWFKRQEAEEKMAFIIFWLIFAVSAPRCSSGFDRHRQDWVDNSCPDEVLRHNLRERVGWKAYCNLFVCWEAASFRRSGRTQKTHFHIIFLLEWLHTAVTAFLIFQTKDKLCDIIDTTHLYPFTTTVVAKTTSRSQEATTGQGTPSTSHPPTSIPTEGKIKKKPQIWNEPRAFPWSASAKMLNEVVHLLGLFFIGIDVFALLQHPRGTSLSYGKGRNMGPTYAKRNSFQMANTAQGR